MASKRRKLDPPVTADTIAAAVRGDSAPARAAPSVHFTFDEFKVWVEATCYNLDKSTNRWAPFVFDDWQADEWRCLLRLTPDGTLDALTWMVCWARRHGKSQIAGFYDIKRCQDYNDQNVIICANSADQSEGTVFKLICDTLQNSPTLKRLVDKGDIVVGAKEVYFARTGSRILCIPHSEASAYGKGIHVAHNTELCVARTDDVYQVLCSSTGDKWCGVVICDSNVGDESNAVVKLLGLGGVHFRGGAIERGPAEDPSIAVSYVGYESIDDAIDRGPRWISRAWLNSRRQQMTAGEFKRNHFNIPSSGSEVCFPLALVKRAVSPWLPAIIGLNEFAAIRQRYQGAALHIGGGLDRSTGLSVKADRSIWTVTGGGARPDLVGKTMQLYDEEGNPGVEVPADPWEYVVLSQFVVPMGMDKAFKDAVEQDRKVFGRFTKITLEAYQARDLYDWACGKGYDAELVHMTWQAKAQLVRMMLELLHTDRLRFSPANWLLYQELLNYREDTSSATPSYEGPRRKVTVDVGDGVTKDVIIKDDALESAMWSIWGLRGHKRRPFARATLGKPAGF